MFLQVLTIILVVGLLALGAACSQFWKEPHKKVDSFQEFERTLAAIAAVLGLLIGFLIRQEEVSRAHQEVAALRSELDREGSFAMVADSYRSDLIVAIDMTSGPWVGVRLLDPDSFKVRGDTTRYGDEIVTVRGDTLFLGRDTLYVPEFRWLGPE